ncbi:MAG: hypothetical protein ACXAB7_14495 [Candidatus Kariarchaeaceae archaeon]|jgi:hypothetical protein
MSFDILAILDLFVKFALFGMGMRYIIAMLPEGATRPFNNSVVYLRNRIIANMEALWVHADNCEVIFLTRFATPFAFLVYIMIQVDKLGSFLHEYDYVQFLFFVFYIFLFINVAPSVEDAQMLFDTSDASKLLFIIKIVVALTFMTTIPGILTLSVILLPVTAWTFEPPEDDDWS